MLISDVHAQALQLLNSDTSDYPAEKLMPYTNDGINYINNLRIGAKDPEVVKQVTITTDIQKPSDFCSFVPPNSSYPLNAFGSTISRQPGAPPIVVFKYSTKVSRVSSAGDTFPLPDEYLGYVAQYIDIRLKEDNGNVDVTQLMNILANDTNAFIKAKGG